MCDGVESELAPLVGGVTSGRRSSRLHAAVFVLSFLSYAVMHLGRKALSAIKPVLIEQHVLEVAGMPADQMFGLLDSGFLLFYSFGLFVSGLIADRHEHRKVIFLGLALSGLLTACLGVGGLLGVRSLSFYATAWSINGLVQSSGWPANVALMGTWFVGARGAIFGLWSCCPSVGNIMGTLLVLTILDTCGPGRGWQLSLIVSAAIMLAQALLVSRLLPRGASRAEAGRDELGASPEPPPHGAADEAGAGEGSREESAETHAISFTGALLLPGVLPYSLCYACAALPAADARRSAGPRPSRPRVRRDPRAPTLLPVARCLKGVDYAFFFWVPRYLQSAARLSSAQADRLSVLYDVGQLVGGVLAGAATDGSASRAPLTVAMLLAAAPCIWFVQGRSHAGTVCVLLALGLTLGGPTTMVSGCIAADLGQSPALRGKERALATVTGIIDGSGSLGAALAQYVVGSLAPRGSCGAAGCDWSRVFSFLLVADLVAAVCLLPVLRPVVSDLLRGDGTGGGRAKPSTSTTAMLSVAKAL